MTTQDYQAMRFQAACAAMSNMMTSDMYIKSVTKYFIDAKFVLRDFICQESVRTADALLKELGVEEPKE